MKNLVGAFLAWVEKNEVALAKRLGPKLFQPFMQYVDMFKRALEKK